MTATPTRDKENAAERSSELFFFPSLFDFVMMEEVPPQ